MKNGGKQGRKEGRKEGRGGGRSFLHLLVTLIAICACNGCYPLQTGVWSQPLGANPTVIGKELYLEPMAVLVLPDEEDLSQIALTKITYTLITHDETIQGEEVFASPVLFTQHEQNDEFYTTYSKNISRTYGQPVEGQLWSNFKFEYTKKFIRDDETTYVRESQEVAGITPYWVVAADIDADLNRDGKMDDWDDFLEDLYPLFITDSTGRKGKLSILADPESVGAGSLTLSFAHNTQNFKVFGPDGNEITLPVTWTWDKDGMAAADAVSAAAEPETAPAKVAPELISTLAAAASGQPLTDAEILLLENALANGELDRLGWLISAWMRINPGSRGQELRRLIQAYRSLRKGSIVSDVVRAAAGRDVPGLTESSATTTAATATAYPREITIEYTGTGAASCELVLTYTTPQFLNANRYPPTGEEYSHTDTISVYALPGFSYRRVPMIPGNGVMRSFSGLTRDKLMSVVFRTDRPDLISVFSGLHPKQNVLEVQIDANENVAGIATITAIIPYNGKFVVLDTMQVVIFDVEISAVERSFDLVEWNNAMCAQGSGSPPVSEPTAFAAVGHYLKYSVDVFPPLDLFEGMELVSVSVFEGAALLGSGSSAAQFLTASPGRDATITCKAVIHDHWVNQDVTASDDMRQFILEAHFSKLERKKSWETEWTDSSGVVNGDDPAWFLFARIQSDPNMVYLCDTARVTAELLPASAAPFIKDAAVQERSVVPEEGQWRDSIHEFVQLSPNVWQATIAPEDLLDGEGEGRVRASFNVCNSIEVVCDPVRTVVYSIGVGYGRAAWDAEIPDGKKYPDLEYFEFGKPIDAAVGDYVGGGAWAWAAAAGTVEEVYSDIGQRGLAFQWQYCRVENGVEEAWSEPMSGWPISPMAAVCIPKALAMIPGEYRMRVYAVAKNNSVSFPLPENAVPMATDRALRIPQPLGIRKSDQQQDQGAEVREEQQQQQQQTGDTTTLRIRGIEDIFSKAGGDWKLVTNKLDIVPVTQCPVHLALMATVTENPKVWPLWEPRWLLTVHPLSLPAEGPPRNPGDPDPLAPTRVQIDEGTPTITAVLDSLLGESLIGRTVTITAVCGNPLLAGSSKSYTVACGGIPKLDLKVERFRVEPHPTDPTQRPVVISWWSDSTAHPTT